MLTACPAPAPQNPQDPVTPATGDGAADAASLIHPSEVHLAEVRQLTRDSGENAEAYWSFGGEKLIFQTTRPPYECDQIMTVPADGSAEPTLVSTGKGRTTCAYYLPGDQEIVYSSTHEISEACPPRPDFSKGYVWALYDYDVYRANADGSNLRKLTDRRGYDAEATVCAKDGSIIFTSDRDGDLDLYRMDSDGKNVVRLTDTPGYDGGAFFSQDCSQIVWRASRFKQGPELDEYQALLKQKLVRPSKLEIFVANADGSNVRQLTYLDAASFAPYFHPSGKRVLFSTAYGDPRSREFNIWAVNTDGSDLQQITFAPGFDGFPMFSHDGKWLAFASNRNQAKEGETDVYVARWVESPPAQASREAGPVERFRDNVAWLADDAREGRGIGTRGLEQSADWLAENFQTLGATGAGDGGGYKQALEMPVARTRDAATRLVIDGKPVAAEAFTPVWFSANKQVTAPVVFANYGIVAKELGVDDYKRRPVKGKIVVVRRFTPTVKPFDSDGPKRRYGDLEYKAFEARQRGAVGMIVVDLPAPGEKEADDAGLPALHARGQGDAGIPVMIVSRDAGARLAKGWHRVTMNSALEAQKTTVHNVVAKISAGASDRLPGAVVIGAHYDHLGHSSHPGSLESPAKDGKPVIHNGADDNASGTAALVTIARSLMANRDTLRRDVYLVGFTAEESGLVGSAHFVKNLPDGLKPENVVAMLNMDMIGRMRNNKLSVLGTNSATEWSGLVKQACDTARLRCSMGGDGYGPSDQMAFYRKGIPVLHFFTGGHLEYHKGSDDSPTINAAGGVKVAEVVASLAGTVASSDKRLTYQKAPMPPPRGDVRATGGSLGTIPAYGEGDGKPGVLLGDVRPGGPAANAGVRGGDRIVRIGDSDIRTIRDLMFVLRTATPGQKAKIMVIRDGKRVTLEATYGTPRRRGPSSRR